MTAAEWLELARQIARGDIRALSIRQPYPHHIFSDGKDVENRDWSTRFRGWAMVHAGQRSEDADLVRQLSLPLGGIVGLMRISDCVRQMNSEWFFGPYGFVIAESKALPLEPCKGALGFFLPDPGTCAGVAAHVRTLAA